MEKECYLSLSSSDLTASENTRKLKDQQKIVKDGGPQTEMEYHKVQSANPRAYIADRQHSL